jgi:MFS family permease
MGVGALGAIVLGRLFDRYGIRVPMGAFFLSAFFGPLVFLGSAGAVVVGTVLWGLGMSAQESVLKSLITGVVRTTRRATAFGVFDTGFGICWFAGRRAAGCTADLRSDCGAATADVRARVLGGATWTAARSAACESRCGYAPMKLSATLRRTAWHEGGQEGEHR